MRHRPASGSLNAGGTDLKANRSRNRWIYASALLLGWVVLGPAIGVSKGVSKAASNSDEVDQGRSTPPLPAPGSDAWQPLVFAGVSRHTLYSQTTDENHEALRAESNCAASGLVLPVEDIDLSATPLLSWRWRVDQPLDISDERSKPGDDFAARVYVLFRFDSERASAFEWLRHRVGSVLYGDQTPGKSLNFVWTSHAQPGESWDNPFAADAKMIALARGGSAEWRSETVDVVEHHQRHFGSPVGELMGLAVMTDSDNSCQTARARYSNFSFSSRPDSESRQQP